MVKFFFLLRVLIYEIICLHLKHQTKISQKLSHEGIFFLVSLESWHLYGLFVNKTETLRLGEVVSIF